MGDPPNLSQASRRRAQAGSRTVTHNTSRQSVFPQPRFDGASDNPDETDVPHLEKTPGRCGHLARHIDAPPRLLARVLEL